MATPRSVSKKRKSNTPLCGGKSKLFKNGTGGLASAPPKITLNDQTLMDKKRRSTERKKKIKCRKMLQVRPALNLSISAEPYDEFRVSLPFLLRIFSRDNPKLLRPIIQLLQIIKMNQLL